MIPVPVAVGLHLCHELILQPVTHEVTLTRVFRVLRTPLHPSVTVPFWAFTAIQGAQGHATLRVVLLTLSEHDVVYSVQHPVEFRDRFTPVYLTLRLAHCRFPRAGGYEMMLMVDQDVIAQRVFHVVADGGQP